MVIWITGLSASGKTTLGRVIYNMWKAKESNTVFIDGDAIRRFYDNPGYTVEARQKNADFICKLCKWLDEQKINVVCCILSIFDSSRRWNRENYSKYFEVYIDVSMKILKKRDTKGLYSGKVKNVVGMDISFFLPEKSDYVFDNNADSMVSLDVAAEKIFLMAQKNV